jgi:uncharacterized RDD family membrane protein YckC
VRTAADRAARTRGDRRVDVVVGLGVVTYGLGRLALLPARVIARSPLVAPVVDGATSRLAARGRKAEVRGRRLLDAQRVVHTPAFEQLVRDAAESRVARDLTDEAIRSEEIQRALEEVLAGPAVINALDRQTTTLATETAGRIREGARRLDERAEATVRAWLRREPRPDVPYAAVATRGVAFAADAVITQFVVLVVGALVGAVASFAGTSLADWLVVVLAGSGWTLFVGAYFVFFWTALGQTPGMRLAALHLTGHDGRTPRATRSVVRFAVTLLAIAPLCVGLVPILFDGRRRALQDFVAGTYVVRDELESDAISGRGRP